MNDLKTTPESTTGFTLPELLMASGLAAVVLLSFMTGFVQQRKVMAQKTLEQDLQVNVRNALGFVQKDLRFAGSGLVMGTSDLDDWFAAAGGVGGIPHIVDGGSGPDTLITAGYAGKPVAELDGALSAGDTVITIDPSADTVMAYEPRTGDVLVLAGVEAVLVASVSGSDLTIRTDPSVAGSGLELDYPDGAEIYQLNVVTYRVQTMDGRPGLTREDTRFQYGTEADKLVAADIEDFQVARIGDRVEVTITGRAPKALPEYEREPDGHPRYTLSSSTLVKSTSPRLSVRAWPEDMLVASAATAAPGGTPTATPSATPSSTPGGATPTPAPTATLVPQPTATPAPTPTPTTRPHDPGKKQHCWCWHVDRGANHP